MLDRLFYAGCLGFLIGTLVFSFLFTTGLFIYLGLILSLGVFLFLFFLTDFRIGAVVAFFLVSLCLGGFRVHSLDFKDNIFFDKYIGINANWRGVVVDAVASTEGGKKAYIQISEGDFKTIAMTTLPPDLDLRYGDVLALSGKISLPKNFKTENDRDFDYINYLRKDGVSYLMYYPKVEILERGQGNWLKRYLFGVKDSFLTKIQDILMPPKSTLLGGLLLGERSLFDKDLRQAFVDTGTIHIVALSGYNITIVSEWFMKIFAFLPFVVSIWSGVFAIFIFVLMTGASSTAVRAGIMATLVLFARLTGRTYDVARALLLAGSIMVFINPLILRYDISFQLSFLATIALIFYAPRFTKYFMWVTPRMHLREIFSVTIAVYIFVLPFILYNMGNFSLVAIPANISVLPIIPLTMGFGFLAGFTGFISPGISMIFGYIASLFLGYEIRVIEFFASLPFASFGIPKFSIFFVIAFYASLLFWLFYKPVKDFLKESF